MLLQHQLMAVLILILQVHQVLHHLAHVMLEIEKILQIVFQEAIHHVLLYHTVEKLVVQQKAVMEEELKIQGLLMMEIIVREGICI